jgi:DNA/RNA-binding domain of Phe-tRNA-synthetase-like protein
VWRDDVGVTCRRWKWRQGARTRLTEESTRMWFILERLEAMPRDALLEAGQQLLEGLLALCPGALAREMLIETGKPI